MQVVRICDGTLRKRLDEFEETDASDMTIDQFHALFKVSAATAAAISSFTPPLCIGVCPTLVSVPVLVSVRRCLSDMTIDQFHALFKASATTTTSISSFFHPPLPLLYSRFHIHLGMTGRDH